MREYVFFSGCATETEMLGERMGRLLPDGAIVLLVGDIGAGKTCFARGLAKGLGIDPLEVSSPTFTLVQEYGDGRRMYHMDLYRIDTLAEAEHSGLMEYFSEPGVAVVEWPAPIEAEISKGAYRVSIEQAEGEDCRRILMQLPDGADKDLEGL